MEAQIRSTIARLLQCCKNMKQLKQIHSQITASPHLSLPDHYHLISRLLFFCAISNSGSLDYADRVFRLVENPNLFIYNVMIRAYACNIDDKAKSYSFRSLILYKQMLVNSIWPDCLTVPFLLKECVNRSDDITGRSIHVHAVKFGLENDVYVGNTMISLYSSCGVLDSARRVFDGMSVTDAVSWSSMIGGFLRRGEIDVAMDLFRRTNKRNIYGWNSIITGLVQGGRPREAIELFHEMQISGRGMVLPDKITVASVLSACASLGALDCGKWVHSYLVGNGVECDMVVGTALVYMYGKCGDVGMAVRIFTEMPEKDVLAWTSMILVFAHHGCGKEAFDLFERMVAHGVKPNQVTFVGLLTACAHSGLVERGRWCFSVMKTVYLIAPLNQHYACMVDVLSRAGLFDEAKRLIVDMPMEPDVFVWGALLGGCQMHGNVELGEKVAQHLIDIEPLNHAFYVTLCDIYAKAGRFDNLKHIRDVMDDKGIKKVVPGSSMIEVDGIVYEFSVRGSTEAVMEEIKCTLFRLSKEMKREGNMFALLKILEMS